MAEGKGPDIAGKRLPRPLYEKNFSDLHPPLDHREALVESERCYFCHDAPCMTACPTSIDIPMFIRQIAAGHPKSAAKTIFDQNIFGGMCARVCPTETLCEEVCVRETSEGASGSASSAGEGRRSSFLKGFFIDSGSAARTRQTWTDSLARSRPNRPGGGAG